MNVNSRHFVFLITLFSFFSVPLFSVDQHEKVVILGTGPAGLTAAIYTARAGLSTLVMEGDEPGGQIALSYKVENFPGFPEGVGGFDLVDKMREQAIRFGTKIRGGKIAQVDLSKRPFLLKMESGACIYADALIIAAGASAKWLGLDSEKAFIGNGVSSCAVCDGFQFKDQEVVVVGGGDTALEDALYLTNYASKVSVVHRRSSLKASKYLQEKAFSHEKISFIWDHTVEEISDPMKGEIAHILLKNVHTDKRQKVSCQGIFIAIGHAPNTDLFQGQLLLDEAGYILTNPGTTMTNVPGVFAAGDVVDTHYRQAVTAAGSGCMAGIDTYRWFQSLDTEDTEKK